MHTMNAILLGTMLAVAGCASTPGTRAPDARTPVPYEADSSSSAARGGSGKGATVSGKDDTAPPRGDPSAGQPPPRIEPQELPPPRQEDLPPLR